MHTIDFGNKLRGRQHVRCGKGEQTLIIASVGTSNKEDSLSVEVKKAIRAAELGAHVVTDHSFYGDVDLYQRALSEDVDASVSAVTCYEYAARCRDNGADFYDKDGRYAIDLLEEQLRRGLDIITIHASFLRKHSELLAHSSRLIPSTRVWTQLVHNLMAKI